jgi:hypothetical protein
LGGNFLRLSEREGDSFRQAIVGAASAISDRQIDQLLTEKEWRGRLCAAWFTALDGRAKFIRSIGVLLLASEVAFAGEGYCVALGLGASEECARLLRSYLKTYLPPNGRIYDQAWAIGALSHIEGAPPPEYLNPTLWRDGEYFMDPAGGVQKFGKITSYLGQHRMIKGAK